MFEMSCPTIMNAGQQGWYWGTVSAMTWRARGLAPPVIFYEPGSVIIRHDMRAEHLQSVSAPLPYFEILPACLSISVFSMPWPATEFIHLVAMWPGAPKRYSEWIKEFEGKHIQNVSFSSQWRSLKYDRIRYRECFISFFVLFHCWRQMRNREWAADTSNGGNSFWFAI